MSLNQNKENLQQNAKNSRPPSFGKLNQTPINSQNSRKRRSTISYIDRYANTMVVLQRQKSKNNLDYIRKKYLAGIDKNYVNMIQNKPIHYNKEDNLKQIIFKRSPYNNNQNIQQQNFNKTIAKPIPACIFESPYTRLKQSDKQYEYVHYSALTQRKPINSYKKQLPLKQDKNKAQLSQKNQIKNKNKTNYQESCLKKIKKRIKYSLATRLQNYLQNDRTWVNQMKGVFIKQQKLRNLLKQNILKNVKII